MPIEVLAGLMFGFGVSTLMLTISKPIGAVLCAMLSRWGRRGRKGEGGREGGREGAGEGKQVRKYLSFHL
jgi:hypothetical protein